MKIKNINNALQEWRLKKNLESFEQSLETEKICLEKDIENAIYDRESLLNRKAEVEQTLEKVKITQNLFSKEKGRKCL